MASTILEEFLVKLGFSTDLAQHRRFEDNIKSSNVLVEKFSRGLTDSLAKFTSLATAATGSAVTIAAAMGKISEAMAGTSYAADRIGISIGAIRAMDTAVRSVGGSAGEAQSMMERLAQHMAQQPGFLLRFGIDPDTKPDEALLKLGDYFRRQMQQGEVGRAVATRQAEAAGISYQEMLRIADPRMRPIRNQTLGQRGGMGVDDQQIREQSERFNRLLSQVQERFQAFDDWLYTTWGRQFNDAMQNALGWFDRNLPKIQSDIVGAEGVINTFIRTISDFWNSLSPGAQENIEAIGVIAVLARLSSFSLLRIPGQIIAIATAIGYLVSGYEHWKETGQSTGLIDWTKWGPGIDKATAALTYFNEKVISPLTDKLGIDKVFIPAFEAFSVYLALKWLPSVALSFGKAALSAGGFWGKLSAISAALVAIETWRKSQDPATYAPEHLAPDSPFWRSVPIEQQKQYPNSPYNQQMRDQNAPSFWQSPLDWTKRRLGFGSADPGHVADRSMAPEQQRLLNAIAAGESAGAGGYAAQNPTSSAHGRYQFINSTDQQISQETGLPTDDPVSQDRKAWYLAAKTYFQSTGRELKADLAEGGHEQQIMASLRPVWPSLPGGSQANPASAEFASRIQPDYTKNLVSPEAAPAPSQGVLASALSQLGSLIPQAEAAPAPPATASALAPTGGPVGALGLTRKPDGTLGTPAAGGLGVAAPQPAAPQPATAPDITLAVPPIAVPPITLPRVAPVAPPAAVLAVPPAAPPPATVNNNTTGDTNHVSQNFAPNITVSGVQDPQRAAQLIDRNINRQWTEYGVHSGSAYA